MGEAAGMGLGDRRMQIVLWSLPSSRETSVHELSAHGVRNGQGLLGRIQSAENGDWEEGRKRCRRRLP